MAKKAAKQPDDWVNHETAQVADFVFGDRRSCFYMQDILSEGRDLIEQSRILYEYTEGFPPLEWENYTRKKRASLMNKVKWEELTRLIMNYKWGEGTNDADLVEVLSN